MLIAGKIILTLILFYEVYRIVNMNDFLRTIKILMEVKELEKGSPELLEIGHECLDNKNYIFIAVAEFVYSILTIFLLFTPYFWISAILIIQSFILWFGIKNKVNKNVLYIDSLITIIVIVVGFILMGN